MSRVFAMLTSVSSEHGGDARFARSDRTQPRPRTMTNALSALLTMACLAHVIGAQSQAYLPTRVDTTSQRPSPRLTGPLLDRRVVIETGDRTLIVLQATDTVYRAPIGVGTGLLLRAGERTWHFRTPAGERRVLRKLVAPVWVPPDWHYAETARNHGLVLVRLTAAGINLRSGARLEIRDNAVGIVVPGRDFAELPVDEHIVFEGRLFIPPLGTQNRRVEGNLGSYALDL